MRIDWPKTLLTWALILGLFLIAVCSVFANASNVVGQYFNFSGADWIEVDAGSDITKSATSIDVSSMIRNVNSYVYKDYAPRPFGNFIFDFQVNMSAAVGTSGLVDVFGMFNGAGFTHADQGTVGSGFTTGVQENPDGVFKIFIDQYEGGFRGTGNVTISLSTDYFCRVIRNPDNLRLQVYSDSTRTTLVGEVKLDSIRSQVRYSRIKMIGSREASGTDTLSFVVSKCRFVKLERP